MNTYVIYIDDDLYESADNYEVAKYLYDTVDASCLLEYNGHRKYLMARIDGQDYKLKSGTISKSPEDVVKYSSPVMMLCSDGRVNKLPEDSIESIKRSGYLRPVRLDASTTLYVNPNPRNNRYNPLATGICRIFAKLSDVVVGDVVLCLSERA